MRSRSWPSRPARQAALLEEQARRCHPAVVALADPAALAGLDLPAGTSGSAARIALVELATRPDVDLVIVATGGVVSLRPTLAALDAGKVVATANKETLVAGGHLVMALARAQAAEAGRARPAGPCRQPAGLAPADRFRALGDLAVPGRRRHGRRRPAHPDGVRRPVPRRSLGGARGRRRPEQALRHPTWQMGAKITIDSATLANKGLEVIEAHWLYDVGYDAIEVLIHPQSVVHSAVLFVDGSLKAQIGTPDMRLPIQYAVTYPNSTPIPGGSAGPAQRRSPRVRGARRASLPGACASPVIAGRIGSRATAALIAADEVAVARFLAGSLAFARDPAPARDGRGPLRRRSRPGARTSMPWSPSTRGPGQHSRPGSVA